MGGGWWDVVVSTAIFILLLHDPAIVTFHNTLHKLSICDLGKAHMVQSSDQIIYLSRQPDEKCVSTN